MYEKGRSRYALDKLVTIFTWLITKILFAWSNTDWNGLKKERTFGSTCT